MNVSASDGTRIIESLRVSSYRTRRVDNGLPAEPVRQVERSASDLESDRASFTAQHRLVLEFESQHPPLIIHPLGALLIGRSDGTTFTRPAIDLSPYQAIECGVSRAHSLLQREGTTLLLSDLGSRNGTYLNGQLLQPYQAQPLRDGDEIIFGALRARVIFEDRDKVQSGGA